MDTSKGKALLEELLHTPREERVEKLRKLSQGDIKENLEALKQLEELLNEKEAALQKQLSIVEARGEWLRDNLAIVASFVKPKGKA